MAMLKRLIDRAREVAEERLPSEVLDAGRRLRDKVAENAPAPVRDVLSRYAGSEPPQAEPSQGEVAHDDDDVVVVVYATVDEQEEADAIREVCLQSGIAIRPIDLTHDPKVRRQLADLTEVKVPPYVYINGRFWGARYDIEALAASGDLALVVEGRLDELSDAARRIGNVRESFSDALTLENILDRLGRGHILCVDDLDCWYEGDAKGEGKLYYDGAPRRGDELEAVAREIVERIESDGVEAIWRFEPEVHLP